MIGITFWQWIVEIIISVILAFLHMIRGENRALEHFIVLFLAMISYVFFPAFLLGVSKTHKPTQTPQTHTDLQKDTL